MFTLVTGGAASGKSAYAEMLLQKVPCEKRYYLATMLPDNSKESEMRIARHRAMRADKGFETLERYHDLSRVCLPVQGNHVCLLLECLSNLLANELFSAPVEKPDVETSIVSGVLALQKQVDDLVVVTNEIFSDGVYYDAATERYISLLGKINQRLATQADRVVEVVCGIPVIRKGES